MKVVMISSDKLSKTFSTSGIQQHVLKNIDMEIHKEDFTVIMGASGAGKSTLLYALSGMDKPTLGKIIFDNKEITQMSSDQLAVFRRKHCGFVFQQIYLMDSMSVLDNILAPAYLISKNKSEIINKAKELLEKVGIDASIYKKFPSQLSGGEAQRCGIVRALINNPAVLFADEPTGQLNSNSSQNVLDVFTQLNREKQSIVLVTHDLKTALRGNRIIYLKDGIIHGECKLDAYQSDDDQRVEKLTNFLFEMGW